MCFERHAPAFVASPATCCAPVLTRTRPRRRRSRGRTGASLALGDDERLRGWLLGIARIVALDMLALRRRDGVEAPAAAAPAEVIDLDATPEHTLLDAEAEAMLLEELSRLPAPRRAALALRLDHHLGYGEIAEAMGWSVQKVKNEIHRARLSMRDRVLAYLRGAR